MSDRVDRILGILDVGIQTSEEHGYGSDFDRSACSRCQHNRPEDGDLCAGCRSFLLGDSDDDPTTERRILGQSPDGPPIFDEIHGFPPLPDAPFPRRPLDEWSLHRPQRRRPTTVDTTEGLLCVGGPLDGRLVANDSPWLRAVVPTPLSYSLAASDLMSASIETVTYSRQQVAWRGDNDELFLASCWVLEGDSGRVVVDSLNTIAALASLARGVR